MTCIVGLVDGGDVWLGGDSAGVAGWTLSIRKDPKVFKVGAVLIGFTSSFRMGQLLAHTFTPPSPRVGQDPFGFMVADFIPAVRACFERGGWAGLKDGKHEGGQFLVARAGRLFSIAEDFQVGEGACGFAAAGVGADQALGALHATAGLPARKRVLKALEAAEALSIGVRGPFTVEHLEGVSE